MRSAEYDAFGPWVAHVDSPDLVPPLYRDHPLDLEHAVLVLKVPRNITRRDATPDMDLYDHLIIVENDRLELLSRSARGYDVLTVEHSQVAGIDYGADLLDGWLTLFTTSPDAGPGKRAGGGVGGTRRPALSVRYNAVSEEIIGDLVTTIRRLALRATVDSGAPMATVTGHTVSEATVPSASLGLLDLGELDVGLVTAQHALLRAEHDVQTLGFHARRSVTPRSRELMDRVVDLLRPTTLHAAIICASEKEVHVLRRRQWVTRVRRPEHSIGRTILIRSRCSGATVHDDERFFGTSVFSVPTGGGVIELVVPTGSSSERGLSDQLGVALR